MYRHKELVILFLVCWLSKEGISKVAPTYIKLCHGLTPECFKKTVQESIPEFVKGIPALGVNSTDPMIPERVDLTLPGNLKVSFYNGSMTGFRNCIVDSAMFEDDEAEINLHCNVSVQGQYKAKGRILIVTLNGDGDAVIKAPNIILNAKIKFADKVREGTIYYEVKSYEVKHRFEDRVEFVLTELFKGSPKISEAVLAFLNANWRQVAEEFGNPVVETVVSIAFDSIKAFFHSIPKDELFLDV